MNRRSLPKSALVGAALLLVAVVGILAWQFYPRPIPRRVHVLPPDTGMARVQATGVLRVAMDASYPPFAVAAPDGSLHGLDVDLAQLIAQRLNVKPQLLNISEDGLPDALIAGKADVVISEMAPDPRLQLAYSTPYYNAGEVLLVASSNTRVASLADLGRQSVGVELGSDGDEWFRRQRSVHVQVKRYNAVADAVKDLQAGVIAGVITDAPTAADFIRSGARVRIAGPPLTQAPYVIAAAPQNLSLIRAMDDVLAALQSSGVLPELVRRDV